MWSPGWIKQFALIMSEWLIPSMFDWFYLREPALIW